MIRVSVEKILDLKSEWQRLFASTGASPFLSWEWMYHWLQTFGRGRPLTILTAREGRELVAILPMIRERRLVLGRFIDCFSIAGAGAGGADYLDVISRSDTKPRCVRAFIEYLSGLNPQLVEFAFLDQRSETVGLLRSFCEEGETRLVNCTETPAAVCPKIDLSRGWSRLLEHSRRKSNFSRRLRSLEREPDFEFRSVTSIDEIGAAFERFLNLHQMRWRDSGGSELGGHPQLEHFHRNVVRELATAQIIRFDELWLGGECRSSIYGLENGETFYYFNSGYDAAFGSRSVGLVLLGLSIRSACDRGLKTYDFLRGNEAYKFDWATNESELVTIRLARRSVPLFLFQRFETLSDELRSWAKLALPSRLIEPLRIRRRAARRRYQFSDQ